MVHEQSGQQSTQRLLSLNSSPRNFINEASLDVSRIEAIFALAPIFHELLSRDHEDGRATRQPQGVGSEAYLSGTSQGPTPEDAKKDGHIRGRSK